MKKTAAIKNRKNNKSTRYFPHDEIILLPTIGEFPILLQRMVDDDVESTFKLTAVTADFVYYVDEEESDDATSVLMLDRNLKLASDNIFASNDLFEVIETNKGLLWISDAAKNWQDQLPKGE